MDHPTNRPNRDPEATGRTGWWRPWRASAPAPYVPDGGDMGTAFGMEHSLGEPALLPSTTFGRRPLPARSTWLARWLRSRGH